MTAIAVELDHPLYERRRTPHELADRIGITLANLSILKTGKARAIRFSTLDAYCEALAASLATFCGLSRSKQKETWRAQSNKQA